MNVDILYKTCSEFCKKAEGFRTLYHIAVSGGLPKPEPKVDARATRNRYWMKDEPNNGIWLSDDPVGILWYHGIGITGKEKIHIFDVSEDIIKKSGGLHTNGSVKEILVAKELWEYGLSHGKVKYLGTMSERKKESLVKDRMKYLAKKDTILMNIDHDLSEEDLKDSMEINKLNME